MTPPPEKTTLKKPSIIRVNTKLPNCYFNPNHETPLNLQRYTSIVKKVTELLKKPNYQQSNLTAEERIKLKRLSENRNLTIKGAYKCGKIVIIDTVDYIKHCGWLLNRREFYKKLDANPNAELCQKVKQKIDDMLKNNYMIKNPRTPGALFTKLSSIKNPRQQFSCYYGRLISLHQHWSWGTCSQKLDYLSNRKRFQTLKNFQTEAYYHKSLPDSFSTTILQINNFIPMYHFSIMQSLFAN